MAEPDRNDNNNNIRWYNYKEFVYDGRPERAGEVRNCMLVVATVVAAVTFMAAVNPPGGVWHETVPEKGHVAGKSVYATSDHDKGRFYTFVVCNTLAFSSSIIIIQSLSLYFPFFMELVVAVNGMLFSYVIAILAVAPKSDSANFGISVSASILVPVLLGVIRRFWIIIN